MKWTYSQTLKKKLVQTNCKVIIILKYDLFVIQGLTVENNDSHEFHKEKNIKDEIHFLKSKLSENLKSV